MYVLSRNDGQRYCLHSLSILLIYLLSLFEYIEQTYSLVLLKSGDVKEIKYQKRSQTYITKKLKKVYFEIYALITHKYLLTT